MQSLQFNFQKLNCFLIMINFYQNTDDHPKAHHIGLLLVVFLYGLMRDKATIRTLFLLLAIVCDILLSVTENKYFYIAAVVFCFLNLLFPQKLYWMPRVPDGVAYRRVTLPEKYGGLDAALFFPAADSKKTQTVSWATDGLLERMYGSDRSRTLKVPFILYKFVMSYVKRYKLRFSKSMIKPKIAETIVFSHGLTADIHSYSTLLTNLAKQNLIITVQHKEKFSYEGVTKAERQEEIQQRVRDVTKAYDFIRDEILMKALVGSDWCQPKSTVLMGHSYGGGTSIQAAFTLKEDRPIKCVIALDPWLFPLKTQRLHQKIPSKLLSIQTERFTLDKAINGYNDTFWENNQKQGIRLNLKYADHLHQCDFGFVVGTTLKIVFKPQRTAQFHNFCIQIIRTFTQGVQKNQQMTQIKKQIKLKTGYIYTQDFNESQNRLKKE